MFLRTGGRNIFIHPSKKVLEEVRKTLDLIRPKTVDKIAYRKGNLFILANERQEIYWRNSSEKILKHCRHMGGVSNPYVYGFHLFRDGLIILDDTTYILTWEALNTNENESQATIIDTPDLLFHEAYKFPLLTTQEKEIAGFMAIQDYFGAHMFFINATDKMMVYLAMTNLFDFLCLLKLQSDYSYYLNVIREMDRLSRIRRRIKKLGLGTFKSLVTQHNQPVIHVFNYDAYRGVEIPHSRNANVKEVEVRKISMRDKKLKWEVVRKRSK